MSVRAVRCDLYTQISAGDCPLAVPDPKVTEQTFLFKVICGGHEYVIFANGRYKVLVRVPLWSINSFVTTLDTWNKRDKTGRPGSQPRRERESGRSLRDVGQPAARACRKRPRTGPVLGVTSPLSLTDFAMGEQPIAQARRGNTVDSFIIGVELPYPPLPPSAGP